MIEAKTLPQIVDLGNSEIDDFLSRIDFGHLGLSRNNTPYVVPIHFAYDKPNIYFFTTEGLKTDILEENPTICLQAEDIRNRDDWQSVMITGTAEPLPAGPEADKAMKLIKAVNPKLSPAWSIRWLDDQIRSNVEVVYRISPNTVSGRRTLPKK